MSTSSLRKTVLAAAAASALIAIGIPLALAAPTSVPPSDGEGYVNSTALCASPDTTVIFGSTETSLVAICKTANGDFEYRGVRVRDGARLIVTASRTSDGAYVASNDGVTYTVSATTLSVSVGWDTVRTESWTDFNNPQSPANSTPPAATTKPSTSVSATASSPATASPSKTTATPSTSKAPLPPPLPAEVGGSAS